MTLVYTYKLQGSCDFRQPIFGRVEGKPKPPMTVKKVPFISSDFFFFSNDLHQYLLEEKGVLVFVFPPGIHYTKVLWLPTLSAFEHCIGKRDTRNGCAVSFS